MTKRIALVVAIGLALVTIAQAQLASHYYYWTSKLAPSRVYFRPSSQEMLCASLFNPTANGAVGLNPSGLLRQLGCPVGPPIVVWGENQRGKRKIYAINTIRVRFYGPGTYDGQNGTAALMRELKNNFLMRLLANGDLGRADMQYLPPLRRPAVNGPLPDSPAWQTWRGEERIEISDARIIRKRNLGRGNRTCQRLYGDRCWRADFIWALPIRLVLSGSENGSPVITVTLPGHPDAAFVDQATGQPAALGVGAGGLINIYLDPLETEEP